MDAVTGYDWRVKRVSVSWHRDRDGLVPRREAGLHWTAYQWAWLRLEVER